MESMGHAGITGRICEIKFKIMKAQYKNIKKRNGRTGRRGPPTWPYYDTMDKLLRHDVAVNPQNIAEIGAARLNYIPRRVIRFICEFNVNWNLKFYLQCLGPLSNGCR
jgi:hypothetical protein